MAGQAGRLGRLYVTDDAGVTYTLVGCLLDASFNGTMDTLETTCHDDDQDRSYIASKRSNTIDANYNYVETDAGQVIIKDAYFGTGDGIGVKFVFEVTVGKKEYTADAIVTSWGPGIPNEDVATVDVSFQLTGAVTEGTQS